MFRKKNLTYILLFLLIGLFFIFHSPDQNYLAKKSADDAWNSFLSTLNEIVGKGDYINYSFELNDEEVFNIYGQRISYFVGSTNKINAPKMRRTYVLKTDFKTLKLNNSIEFIVFDEASKQVLESKFVKIQNINFSSLLPPILALILCFLYKRLGFSLLISIFISSVVHRKSLFFGISDVFIKYLPESLCNNNFFLSKILVFFILIYISIYLVSKYGGFKALRNMKKYKLLFFPILTLHPYFFASFGTWLFYSVSKYKIFFVQAIALTSSYFFIFNPFSLNLFSNFDSIIKNNNFFEIFIELSKFKYFSFSLLASLFILYYLNKKKFSFLSSKFFTYSKFVKQNPLILYVPFFCFLFAFYFFSLFIGMIGVEYNGNLIAMLFKLGDLFLNFTSIKNYYLNFQKSDISTALLFSACFVLISIFIVLYFKKLLSFKIIIQDVLIPTKLSFKYLFYLVLSSVFILLMDQAGTSHYIISLFNTKIDPIFFPLICFFISLLNTISFGNSLYVIFCLPAILTPISEQLGLNNSISIISIIIEGAIAGELLCPYSPSSIIVSSIYQNNPVLNIIKQFKPLSLAIIFSSITGFLLINTNIPFWTYYFVVVALCLIFFLNNRNKND